MEGLESRTYPEGIADILRQTFGLYVSNFFVFIGIVGAIQLPVFTVGLLLLSSANAAMWPLPYLGLVLGTGFLATAPATYAISRLYAGAKPGVVASYRNVMPLFLPLLGALLLWTIALSIPLVAAIAGWLAGLAVMVVSSLQGAAGVSPRAMTAALMLFLLSGAIAVFGIVIYSRLLLTPSVVAMERPRPYSALRRSWRLVTGRTWTASGTIIPILLFVAVVQAALMAIVRAVLGVSDAQAALGPLSPHFAAVTGAGMLITMLLWPLPTIATALLYFDLRRHKQDMPQKTETDSEIF